MLDLIDYLVRPQTMVLILAGVAAFATVLTLALPMLSRDRTATRMKVMATERDKMRASRLATLGQDAGGAGSLRQAPKGFMQEIVDQLNLRNFFDSEELRDKMKMAGLRGQAPLVTYMFFRICMPIVAFVLAIVYLFVLASYDYPPIAKFGMAIVAGYLGFYLPNVFIQNLITRRQDSIKAAFPDALDMILICVQAGMSVEAGFAKVSKEIGAQSMELAEELSLTTAELSYLQDRRQAFENMAKRSGLPGVKSVATALIQAERYGTPVGQALRVMAKENREMRLMAAEQKAAALPPKLTVPMIVFNIPVLFAIILGPAAIQVMAMP